MVAPMDQDIAEHLPFPAELDPLRFHIETMRAYGTGRVMQLPALRTFLHAEFVGFAEVPEWLGIFVSHRQRLRYCLSHLAPPQNGRAVCLKNTAVPAHQDVTRGFDL